MSRRALPILAALALVAFGCCDCSALAEEPVAAEIVDLKLGFAGYYKVGYWTAAQVIIRAGSEPLKAEVALVALDGDAVPSRVGPVQDEPIPVQPQTESSVPFFIKIGQLKSEVTVNLRSEGLLIATRTFPTTGASTGGSMPVEDELILILGLPSAGDETWRETDRNTKIAQLANLNALPKRWWGLEGVDAVVLMTAEDEISSQLTSPSAQLDALDRWVQMGGKLILSVGRHGEKVLAAGSALTKLVPGEFESMTPLRQATMLETYAETSDPLQTAGGPFLLHVPKLKDVRGKIEAYAGSRSRDLPLVIRAPRGFGEVVLIAVDLNRAPIAGWVAREHLFDRLLRRQRSSAAENESAAPGQVTTLGFNDLSGQLKGALDQFAGVQTVPFWLVALLVLVYIACIGPLDYWLVKRVLRRMESTWLTFSLTVLLFTAEAWWLAYHLKGRDVLVNQVDLVDVDAASDLVRGTTWSNVFTPKTALTPAPRAVDGSSDEMLFSWLGLPGSGFGGMNSTSGNLPSLTAPYDFARELNALSRVPIAVWSSKSFVNRWSRTGKSEVEADLSDNGKLIGTLKSHLTEPLEDAVLIYDRWAYPLRRLEPGRAIEIGLDVSPQTVETYFRHVTVMGDRDVSKPYDRASFDVRRIVEMLSAYGLSGGERYTGLANHYQSFVEITNLVRNGRAVLIGRRTQPVTELTRDGQPLDANHLGQRWTFYRYVLPVEEK